ncbi:unnamed protein product [Chrysoparadoxa australica]
MAAGERETVQETVETKLFVLHGDYSAELVKVDTSSPLLADGADSLREVLKAHGVVDVLKVKVHDGSYFNGQDLAEWCLDKLRKEVAFRTALTSQIEQERRNQSEALDKVAVAEQGLRDELQATQANLDRTETSLNDALDALKTQKDFRMKEMYKCQLIEKDRDLLKEELAQERKAAMVHQEVMEAVEKECRALRGTVAAAERIASTGEREVESFHSHAGVLEAEIVRLRRRLHNATQEQELSALRLGEEYKRTRKQRKLLWACGINPDAPYSANKRIMKRLRESSGTRSGCSSLQESCSLSSFSSDGGSSLSCPVPLPLPNSSTHFRTGTKRLARLAEKHRVGKGTALTQMFRDLDCGSASSIGSSSLGSVGKRSKREPWPETQGGAR